MEALVLSAYLIGFGALSAHLARRKGRDPLQWGLLGFVLPGPVLIVLACLKPVCRRCGRSLDEPMEVPLCPRCQ